MNISIITPYYYGRKYLSQYIEMINNLSRSCVEKKHQLEVIIVNDSPEESVDIYEVCLFEYKIITNTQNVGIHQSRINGLKESKYEYIIFLDQDDLLEPNCIEVYSNSVKDSDLIIGNGIYEGVQDRYIYKNNRSIKYASRKIGYMYVRNLIVSPGHCLIRKTSIPEEWIQYSMKKNGSDDYFLWLLLFAKKAKVKYCNQCIYVHRDTGENISSDEEKIKYSSMEFLRYMDKIPNHNIVSLSRKVQKTVEFKYDFKFGGYSKKIGLTVKHPLLFTYNCFYHLWYKGI